MHLPSLSTWLGQNLNSGMERNPERKEKKKKTNKNNQSNVCNLPRLPKLPSVISSSFWVTFRSWSYIHFVLKLSGNSERRGAKEERRHSPAEHVSEVKTTKPINITARTPSVTSATHKKQNRRETAITTDVSLAVDSFSKAPENSYCLLVRRSFQKWWSGEIFWTKRWQLSQKPDILWQIIVFVIPIFKTNDPGETPGWFKHVQVKIWKSQVGRWENFVVKVFSFWRIIICFDDWMCRKTDFESFLILEMWEEWSYSTRHAIELCKTRKKTHSSAFTPEANSVSPRKIWKRIAMCNLQSSRTNLNLLFCWEFPEADRRGRWGPGPPCLQDFFSVQAVFRQF